MRIPNDASEGMKRLKCFLGLPNHQNNTSSFPENGSKIDIFDGLIITRLHQFNKYHAQKICFVRSCICTLFHKSMT